MASDDLRDLGLETKTLYECRGCRTVTSSTVGGCPSCGKAEGREVERGSIEGGTTTVQQPWYETLEVVVRA